MATIVTMNRRPVILEQQEAGSIEIDRCSPLGRLIAYTTYLEKLLVEMQRLVSQMPDFDEES
jgi:hypothetical protein